MVQSMWRKVCAVVLGAVLAAVPIAGLTACGANPAEQVKAVVAANLDEVKNLDPEAIDELGSMNELKQIETTYGISADRALKAFYGHFNYTIDEVTVEGDTATVKVTSSNIDLQKVMENYMNSITEFATSEDAQKLMSEGGQKAVQDKVVELLMSSLEADGVPIAEGQTELAMERDGDSWTYANEEEVLQVLFGGQDLQSALSQLS